MMQAGSKWRLAVPIALTLFVAPYLAAQTVAGQVSGLVTDPSGAAITGATIVVTDIDRYRQWFAKPPDRQLLLTLRLGKLPAGVMQMQKKDVAYAHPVELSGTMPMMDWLATTRDAVWVMRDPASGKENMDIRWAFRLGEMVKIRLANDRTSLHPMPHPIHLHGQRFLVLSQNGVPSTNLVWKDTVLLPVGTTADVLVEMSNPGK